MPFGTLLWSGPNEPIPIQRANVSSDIPQDSLIGVLRLAAKWDMPYVLGACASALQDALCAPVPEGGGPGAEALRPYQLLEWATRLGCERLRSTCLGRIAERLRLASSESSGDRARGAEYLRTLALLVPPSGLSAGGSGGSCSTAPSAPVAHPCSPLDAWAAAQLLSPVLCALQQACTDLDHARDEARRARDEAAVLRRQLEGERDMVDYAEMGMGVMCPECDKRFGTVRGLAQHKQSARHARRR
ncbi:hypothetical protein GPECTOR_41g724 [Gonium pectorale]|uniref:C2H2-type domain-containing protein n=1 Tax=Gonium pectorale TaxID=33097 RepID=A0A150GA94_GONPE|nr:hypothetical protein GPECTOR_41g724 [Gonium pectorale]|eukprot:KXZ46759.1 hypothetical protein GPECTOR_41g724 [Gonium pectorale]